MWQHIDTMIFCPSTTGRIYLCCATNPGEGIDDLKYCKHVDILVRFIEHKVGSKCTTKDDEYTNAASAIPLSIENADWVIVVCSPNQRNIFNTRNLPQESALALNLAKVEAMTIAGDCHTHSSKYLLVRLGDCVHVQIPEFLTGTRLFDIPEECLSSAEVVLEAPPQVFESLAGWVGR